MPVRVGLLRGTTMKRLLAVALAAASLASPAFADAARYHRYWKEATEYAQKGFAEADKAVAVMKTDKEEYCFRLSQVRTELERSTKLFMYAFEQIDADKTLTEAEAAKLEPMIDDYTALKPVLDRYVALQETRCLAGPSYADTIPSTSYSSSSSSSNDDDDEDEFDVDEHDAADDDNF